MKYHKILLLTALFAIHYLSTSAAGPQRAQSFLNSKNWNFLENKGQITGNNGRQDLDIKFYGHQGGVFLYCMPGKLSFVFSKHEYHYPPGKAFASGKIASSIPDKNQILEQLNDTSIKSTVTTCRTDLILVNANPNCRIIGGDQQAYYENYYLDKMPEEGITNVHSYKTISYQDIYPHIDMILHTGKSGMKYEFLVHPGGNVKDIKMKWEGLSDMLLTDAGTIHYILPLGEMNESKPLTYQSGKSQIASSFKKSNNIIQFDIANYNPAQDLVIDPGLVWSTFYGGGDDDWAVDIATNSSGDVLVSGLASSSSKIATKGAFQTSWGGNRDGMIVNFSASGSRNWATYFGGAYNDVCGTIGLDSSGSIFVAGWTNSIANIATSGTYQTSSSGSAAFIAKFSAGGSRTWATYFDMYPYGLACDKSGNVIITGYGGNTATVVSSGAYQTSSKGHNDVVVAKFSGSGSFLWGTYFGGTENDQGQSVCCDTSGNIYVAGATLSTSGIASAGAYQTTYAGKSGSPDFGDAIIIKFNSAGVPLWSTYFGGSGDDVAYGIAADTAGNVFITGTTLSSSGIATSGAFNTIFNGGYASVNARDAFLAGFTSVGKILWSTYVGGTGAEDGSAVAIDKENNIIFAGSSGSLGLATSGAFKTINNGDALIAKFLHTGKLTWCTYFGGDETEFCFGVATYGSSDLFITGYTRSTSGLATKGAYQTTNNGSIGLDEAFIAHIKTYNIDAGITKINSPTGKFCGGYKPVKVQLQNYGDRELDSVTVNLVINRKLQTPYKWTGKLQPDSSVSITIGNYLFPPGKDTIRACTAKPNGIVDSVPENDSSIILIDTVLTFPSPKAGGVLGTCLGDSITLGISAMSGHTYTWTSKPSVLTSSNAQITVKPSAPTTYYLKELVNSTGCTASDSAVITPNPKPVAAFSVNNAAQCPDKNSFTFTDKSTIASGSIYYWQWDFGDGKTSLSQNANHSYASAGTYKVTFQVISALGCFDFTSTTITVYPKAKASYVSNSKIQCFSGNNVIFTDKSSSPVGSIKSWNWNFGDSLSSGNFSTNQNPSHSYSSPGIFTAYQKVTDNNGCQDSISQAITINPQPLTAFAIKDSSLCLAKNTFSFLDKTTTPSGLVSGWAWDFGDGSISKLQNVAHVYHTAGIFSVTLKAISNAGCSDSLSKPVRVNPPPISSFFVNNASQCLFGNNFSFSYSALPVDLNSWTWYFGNGDSSPQQKPDYSFSKAGTYSIKLKLTSTYNCSDSSLQTIQVNAMPQPSILGKSILCQDSKTTFTGLHDRGSALNWHIARGNLLSDSTSESIIATWVDSGSGFVILKEINAAGCFDSAIMDIKINPKPVARISSKNSVCISDVIKLNDSSSGASASQWLFGDGDSSELQHPYHNYQSQGNFKVLLSVQNSQGCADTNSKYITVNPLPNPDWNATYVGNTTYLHATDSSLTAPSYHWDFGDATSTGSGHMAKHIFPKNTNYLVKMVITDKNGCKNERDSMLKIDVSSTGSLPKNSGEFTIYPNPFKSSSCISYTLDKQAHVKIALFDITGKEISVLVNAQQPQGKYNAEINAVKYQLSKGIYLVKIAFDNVEMTSQLIKL